MPNWEKLRKLFGEGYKFIPKVQDYQLEGSVMKNVPTVIIQKAETPITTIPFYKAPVGIGDHIIDPELEKKVFLVGQPSIPDNEQGKGLATAAYKTAEEAFGHKIIPDTAQTMAGNILHKRHGRGQDFGDAQGSAYIDALMNRLLDTKTMDNTPEYTDYFRKYRKINAEKQIPEYENRINEMEKLRELSRPEARVEHDKLIQDYLKIIENLSKETK